MSWLSLLSLLAVLGSCLHVFFGFRHVRARHELAALRHLMLGLLWVLVAVSCFGTHLFSR